jgi:pimeloyl-ACP methyl ester carboxylesterase
VYEPDHDSPVLADIVFIHGLGSNSRKTWSLTSDPDHFWPARWLPCDSDFVNTRVHVFGYNADWRDRQHSPLGIYDFAQSLLGELKNDPSIRKDSTPIVLVSHSMGDCVAKKTYILARLDPKCNDLARRIHSMFFLGTPHRGANLAPACT